MWGSSVGQRGLACPSQSSLQALSYACSASVTKVTQKKCRLLASVREAGTIKGKSGGISAKNQVHGGGEAQCC